MNTPRATGRRLSQPIRLAWALVLGMLLAAGAWSLSGQLMDWGMKEWLAWALSVMFDAAGLICATYARRAVERGTPAGLARLALVAFVAVAGVLNWNHGYDIGGMPAAAGFASLSAGVELLFELHRRDIRDEQRAARGLIAERLPHIPLLGWVMYPGRSWETLRAAVGVRLDLLDPVQTGHELAAPDTDTRPDKRHSATVRSAVLAAAKTMPDADAEDIVDQLSAAGIDTDTDTVRDVLDEDTDSRPDTKDSRSQRPRVRPVRPIAPPGQTVADTIRTALASGITDKGAVLSYVRKIHGQDVSADTVRRTRTRIEGKAS
ncbi:DUF2637 domain-containing protein [Streptomyces sp. HP-A2021]|uniref:DUF2637 domain-containing protein n=1 Tax=Streptomyces sp. HP-A2021 TaxID=2927875 RepID=UPI001FAF3F30|nr:DUF2637 domain-containing protein [Streptomyces sp. HP-A2021]UOB09093.1 DUF2637 domain-containing protein [Streptomyces sp. HP-A2021]